MHPYLPHLLADIKAAHRKEKRDEQSIEDHLEAINIWTSGQAEEKTLGHFCGLNSEIFPPADQLSDEEMMIIRNAFNEMVTTWNHAINLPENLPVAFAYQLMVNSLNKKQH